MKKIDYWAAFNFSRAANKNDTNQQLKRSHEMKVWSKGLGKTELLADCRYYEVAKDPESENVFIIGNITNPVNWEFRAILEPEDVPGFMKLVFNGCM